MLDVEPMVSVVSGSAAVGEQQTDSGSVPAAEGQSSRCLPAAGRRRHIQPQLVGHLSCRPAGRPARPRRPHHPHRPAEGADGHRPTSAPRWPAERVRDSFTLTYGWEINQLDQSQKFGF